MTPAETPTADLAARFDTLRATKAKRAASHRSTAKLRHWLAAVSNELLRREILSQNKYRPTTGDKNGQ